MVLPIGGRSNKAIRWVFVLLIALVLVSSGPVAGQGAGMTRSQEVRIEGKTYDAVIVTERHFRVTLETQVFDLRGKRISLNELPVPCKAKIKYRLRMDEDPELVSVAVTKVFPDSTPTWYIPESR
ncbi:MAG: hypothetical protein JRJ29_04295 [Deltaproteobacteria bacterium]|nr:hypothetical protein [Deltaproteobacteria bacterium]